MSLMSKVNFFPRPTFVPQQDKKSRWDSTSFIYRFLINFLEFVWSSQPLLNSTLGLSASYFFGKGQVPSVLNFCCSRLSLKSKRGKKWRHGILRAKKSGKCIFTRDTPSSSSSRKSKNKAEWHWKGGRNVVSSAPLFVAWNCRIAI